VEAALQPQSELEQSGYCATPAQRKAIHDLRNLFAIVGAAKSLLERDPVLARREELLRAIGEATRQGGQLTTALLANSAERSSTAQIDVGERLAKLAPMLRVLANVQVNLVHTAQGSNLTVRMVPSDFDAAVVELVSNAAAAGADAVTIRSRKCGSRVWLVIADNGCGMSAATLARARRGTDLGMAHGTGLSRVRQVMESSHGHLHIRSRSGLGTEIGLTFPPPPGIGGEAPDALAQTPRTSGEHSWKRSICSCSEMSLPN